MKRRNQTIRREVVSHSFIINLHSLSNSGKRNHVSRRTSFYPRNPPCKPPLDHLSQDQANRIQIGNQHYKINIQPAFSTSSGGQGRHKVSDASCSTLPTLHKGSSQFGPDLVPQRPESEVQSADPHLSHRQEESKFKIDMAKIQNNYNFDGIDELLLDDIEEETP